MEFMNIDMRIEGLEFGSGVTRFPGFVFVFFSFCQGPKVIGNALPYNVWHSLWVSKKF